MCDKNTNCVNFRLHLRPFPDTVIPGRLPDVLSKRHPYGRLKILVSPKTELRNAFSPSVFFSLPET